MKIAATPDAMVIETTIRQSGSDRYSALATTMRRRIAKPGIGHQRDHAKN
jgi:hypothetical protein